MTTFLDPLSACWVLLKGHRVSAIDVMRITQVLCCLRRVMRITQLWCCLVLLGVAWCCLVLLGVAWCCLVLLGVAWCCLVLLGVAR